jgi:putative glutamine amidotransferase
MALLVGITVEQQSDPRGLRAFSRGQTLNYLSTPYTELVESIGAQPVLIGPVSDEASAALLVSRLDGLLLSGGADLDPADYGEAELEPGGHVEPIGDDHRARGRREDLLIRAALASGLPILGICRGLQQLNVSLGGSLVQDVERQLGIQGHYELKDPWLKKHDVCITGKFGAELFGLERFAVTSTHHQALKELAPGAELLATDAADGRIPEAVRFAGGGFVVGVQWHPERMPSDDSTRQLLAAWKKAMEERGPA